MPPRECQPRLILAYRDPAFGQREEKRWLSAECGKLSKSGWGVHLNESNSWRDINCDSESELKGVMEPLLISLPCLNLGKNREESQSCLS